MTTLNNDRVSIITPAFCAESVIGETIKSVIAQTHANWEMLIADDCSTDKNAALERASGRWITFLDSDDLWLPQKLKRTLEHAKAYQAALTFTGFRRISENGKVIGRYVGVPRNLSYRQLLGNTAIATSTVLLDRNMVGDIRMKKTHYDDFDCWLQILKGGYLAYGLDENLMHYRVMGASVSRNKRRSAAHVWRAYRDLEGLSLHASIWYFSQYAIRGVLKYKIF